MIPYTRIKYKHTMIKNAYKVYYNNDLIGDIEYTPAAPGVWTFNNTARNAITYGSTRNRAVMNYIALSVGYINK